MPRRWQVENSALTVQEKDAARCSKARLLILPLLLAAPIAAQPTEPETTCSAPEHRQFDFWVGAWDVYRTGTDMLAARSLIESLYGGCAIRENWMPLKGGGGGSLNSYDRGTKTWRQTWVDSSNARVDFSGGMNDTEMVLTGYWKDVEGPGKSGLVRMTYSRGEQGTVRQFGQISTDEGRTWRPLFDFTYRPAKGD